ncbi:MAG: winged helix-turn-helix domain-containing protein [Elusimicrobia bacterium]|nr:winged helix-turn-helix domain-containing protein [Elusimicrobiota bacterium]
MPPEKLQAVILTGDEALFSSLRLRFAESGVSLSLARDASALNSALRYSSPSALILDSASAAAVLGLPPEEAVAKLAAIKGRRALLALAEEAAAPGTVVRLLELGAHDVAQKPLKPRILAEQLKALVRVFAAAPAARRREIRTSFAGSLEMDYPARRCFIANGRAGAKKEVRLTKIEFQVLYLLLRRKGAVVTYADFAERLWPAAVSPGSVTHTLHQLVTNIRKKIASCPVRIENLRAEGFRLS